MSGCADVCIRAEYTDECSFYTERTMTARKAHKCIECLGEIKPGDKYTRGVGSWEEKFHSYATCHICSEIACTFFCDGHAFGFVWRDIRDEMFLIWQEKGPIDCLAKLDTKEARDKCRAEYDKWKSERKK